MGKGAVLDQSVGADIRIENHGSIDMAVSAMMDALMPLCARERRPA
ncbi:MAG: hypothetical protein ACK5PF_02515 [bacterium]